MHRTSHAQPSASSATTADGRRENHAVQVGDIAPVSVVIPCYRCVHTIGHAVASVAAQTVRPAEVLLVEDGSGDGTLEELHRVAGIYPPGWVKVMAMPRNSGPSAARNRGWQHAVQPWVAFLDADDSWHPQKLKLQMEALAEDTQAVLIAHDMNEQTRTMPPPPLNYPVSATQVTAYRLFLLRTQFPTASIILRRDLPFRFDETRRLAEDLLLWAQILLSGHRCIRLNQVLASYHKAPYGAGGLSRSLIAMNKAVVEVRRELHQQGLLNWWLWRLADAVGLLRYLRRWAITLRRRRDDVMLAQSNEASS
ncbi:glycosyltransferase family 2 protein [Dyella nitratireducens]|uniref:Glycosyl transferase n=1 Tax=Dyella nitratireducens TaxID=1849580 RepID=A0ABQ1GFG1_9GAMM|nr:glycosyltransferase family 2 protein [Dyella nitratireducens]GGA42757.1 glycosyl transferase [Dyella nitratireducens]